MNTRVRKVLLGVVATVVVLLLGVGGLMYSAFAGNAPSRNGAGPTPGVETVAMGFVSAFVLDADPGSVALVDTGADATGARLIAALRARGLGPDAVRAIFLTHGHQDHTAAVRAFPRAEVYALAAEVPVIAGTAPMHSPMSHVRSPPPTGLRVTHTLADGETVNVGSLAVRVFALPGHTPGSAAYLAHETLFLGDASSATVEGLVRGPVWLFSEDVMQGRASLRALGARLLHEALPVRALAFAHSGPVVDADVPERLARVQ